MVAAVTNSSTTHLIAVAVGLALAAAACGSSSSAASSSSTGGPAGSSATTTTGTTAPAAARARNLVVSGAVRAQLLAAGAAMHKLPVSDYTGLVHGETYYAYDPATKTYWAGAGLRASRSSIRAQVGDQDDGAYLVFERPADGHWRAWPAGIPGSSQYSCASTPPAAVLTVWGWAPGSCHPG
jgi:hypothetical protein